MAITNYYKNKIIKSICGFEKYSLPPTVYIGLSKTTINDDGSNVSEPSNNTGYYRVEVGTRTFFNTDATNGVITNAHTLLFPTVLSLWFESTDNINIFISASKDGSADNDIIAFNQFALNIDDLCVSKELMIKKGQLKFGFGV